MDSKPSNSYSPRLLYIYSIVLIDIIAGSIMWPVFPKFLQGTKEPALLLALGSAIFIGIQLVTAPLLGKLSDVKGRKPIFLISAIGTFLANLFLIPKNPFAYFSNRTLDGITNGVYTAVRSSITDISDKKDLMKNIGMEGSIVSLGFVIGPLVAGGILTIANVTDPGSTTVLVCTGILVSFLNILLAIFFRETLVSANSQISPTDLWKDLKNSISLVKNFQKILEHDRKNPGFKNIILLQVFLTMCLGYYSYLISFISLGKLQMSTKQISYFFIYFGAISIAINYYFFTYLVQKINPKIFLPIVSFLGILTHIGYAFSGSSIPFLYAIVTIDCFTISFLPGILDGLFAGFTTEENRGELFGISQVLNGIFSIVTSLIYGLLSILSLDLPFYWFALCLVPFLFSKQFLKHY